MKQKVDVMGASLKDVRQQILELQQSLNGLDTTTEEYSQAVESLVGLNHEYTSAVSKAKGQNEILAGSYQAVQAEMKVLREAWRATSNDMVRQDLGERINSLNNELKQLDSTIGDSFRKVGSYTDALQPMETAMEAIEDAVKPVSQQLGELEDAMRQMVANGVSVTDDAFKELAKRAGELKNAQDSVAKIIDQNAQATDKFNNALSVMQTGMGIVGAYEGAMAALGVENENVAKSIQKLNAVMTVLNSLQTINEQLTDKSSGTYKALQKVLAWVNKDTVAASTAMANGATAVTAMSKGTKLLNGALKVTKATLASLGIPALIMLLMTLITNIDKIWNAVKNLTSGMPVLGGVVKALGKAFDYLGEKLSAVMGWWDKVSEDKAVKGFEAQIKVIEDMTKTMERNVKVMESQGKTEAEILEYKKQTLLKIREQIANAERMEKADKERVAELKKQNDEQREQIELEKECLYYKEKRAKADEAEKSAIKDREEARKSELEHLKNYSAEYQKQFKDSVEQYSRETELIRARGADEETIYNREIGLLKLREQNLESTANELERQIELFQGDAEATKTLVEQLENVNNELDQIYFDIRLKGTVRNTGLSEKNAEEAKKLKESMRSQAESMYGEALGNISIERSFVDRIPDGTERIKAIQGLLDEEYRLTMEHIDRMEQLAEGEDEKEKIRADRKRVTAEYEAESQHNSLDLMDEQRKKALETADAVNQSVQSLGSLMGTVSDIMEEEINRKLESGEISEEQAKKEFERVKKLQLAEVWINTLSGAAGAYMQAVASIPSPFGQIIGAANAATAMATGIAQHRQIKATEFGGGGSGSSVGGLQMMAVAPIVDQTQAQNELTTLNIQGGQDKDIRVYILESDIEDSLIKAQVRDTETSFP